MSADTVKSHFLSGKSIFVIGAGLSGFAFVASLRKTWDHDVPFPKITVFDRDPKSAFERRGGYSLSLVGNDASGGLVALRKMGILDDVLRSAISGVDGDGNFKLWTSDWKELASHRRSPMDGLPTSSVRISRRDIRQILLEAAQLDHDAAMYWNTRCVSVSKLPTGRLAVGTLRGDENEAIEMECDLVIVADGANSKICKHLRPTDTLQYTGAVMRTAVSRFTGPLPEQVGRNWGFVLSGTGTSCFLSPVGENELQWAVGHFEDKASTDKSGKEHAKQVIQRASELSSHIAEPFKTIISQTVPDTVMCINAHDKLPFRHSDIGTLPVVFIGDANHALSPFAGFGANIGLSDGWDLAEQLANGDSLAEAVRAYDDISFPRAAKVIKGARQRLRAGHSTGLSFPYLLAASIPAHPTHPPAIGQPLRIQIEGPKGSIDKLLPGISWQTSVAIPKFPQPAGPKLAALAYEAVYDIPPRPGTDDLAVRDEYLGWIMKPKPTREIDYYGVTFDHGVPADEINPMVLQINILEMEEDNGAYAREGISFPVNPSEYARVRILAVPRCCQKRKGAADRTRINSSVQTRDALQVGISWSDRVEQLKIRGELRSAKPVV